MTALKCSFLTVQMFLPENAIFLRYMAVGTWPKLDTEFSD
jgi:hypothetical protein